MKEKKIKEMQSLLEHLRSKGFAAASSHERENWGETRYSPEKCTPLDLEEIKKSDILLAIPGNPPSGGVHIELGWASALGKKIIVLLEEGHTYSNLVHGLPMLTNTVFIRYKMIDKTFKDLDRVLDSLLR